MREAIARAVRRLPAVLGAAIWALLLLGVLAVATPFIVNAGIFGLVVTPLVRRLQRRRPLLRWFATRNLVLAAIPFALVARQVLRWVFILPAALDGGGPKAILRRSTQASVGRMRPIASTLAAALAAVVALQAIGFGLVSMTSDVGVQGLVIVIAVAASGWVYATTIVVLYRGSGSNQPQTPNTMPLLPNATQARGLALSILILSAVVLWPIARANVATAASGGGGTFTVNDLSGADDATPGDGICATATGTCTLVAAVQEVNAAPMGSTSDIGFGIDGTITLSQPLMIQKGVTIDGASHKVTVDGGGASQLFIFNGDGSTWTLKHLTIANAYMNSAGSYGAAINSSATGNIDSVTFTNNNNVQGSGGAIAAWSTLTIANSTFSGNTAGAGGADAWSGGTMNIANSTFIGGTGGPIDFTFSGSLDNSIVAGAGGAFGCTTNPGSGGTVTGTNNVANDTSCPGSTVSAAMGLGTLADHGGDVATYSLNPTSPAIDTGATGSCPSQDARGIARPQLSGCDIGATEYDPSTTTTLTASPSTAMPGDTVNVQATVTSTNETAAVTGNVTFKEGATTLGTVTLDGAATANLAVSTFALGSHNVTATYNATSRFTTSNATTNVTIKPGALSVNLTPSQTPTNFGEAETFTATLNLPGPTPATGNVTFKEGATTLATVALSGATATYSTSTLSVGGHDITATYNGDANYDPATSPTSHVDVKANVTIEPSATPASPVYGNPVTIAAHLSSPDVAGVPTGTVLVENGAIVGTTTLDASGDISFTTDQLPAGTDSVLIIYQGDSTFAATTTTIDVNVTDAATTTSLSVTPSSTSVIGASIDLHATVATSGTPLQASGAAEFFDGTTSLGTVALDAAGQATFTTTSLGLGNHQLHATYLPGSGFATSSSTPVGHDITTVATTTQLSADSVTSVRGQNVHVQAQVSPVASVAVPTGNVTFAVDGTDLATVPLDATGVASVDLADLGVGNHTITATYGGASAFAPSTATPLAHSVTRAASTVTLNATPSTGAHGQSITLQANVTAVTPGNAIASGTVTFSDGVTNFGSATLDGTGTATLAVPLLGAGSHTVTAYFAGDANLTAGTGTVTVTVNPVNATMVAVATPPTTTFGSTVTFKATVTTATGAIATGTITIFDDDSSFSTTVALDSAGVATIGVNSLGVGLHHLRFNYSSSDVNFTTAATQVTITQATPSVSVSLDNPSVQVGSLVTATATVQGATVASPSGQVQFLVDGTVVDTEYLTIGSNGASSATYRFMATSGSHSIRVLYLGDAGYAFTIANATTLTVNRVSPTVTAAFAPATIYAGQAGNYTASVATAPGHAAPTGTVTFQLDGIEVGTANLVNGVATFVGGPLTVGAHSVVAEYGGDGVYASGSASASTTVLAPPTVVSIGSSIPNPYVQQSVTYTVNVNELYGAVPLNGNVWVKVDGVTVNGSGVSSTGVAAQVTFDISIAGAGPHTVTAEFTPSTGAVTGSTGSLNVTVNRYDATLTLGLSKTNPTVGEYVIATVTSSTPPGAPSVLNTLFTVSDGAGSSCVVAGPAGTCQLLWSAAGSHTVTVTSAPTNVFNAATSNPVAVSVLPGTPFITARSDTVPWVVGDPIEVGWNVIGPTTGNVTVSTTGGHMWCTVPVAQGKCTGTFLGPERSIGSVTVRFNGTTDYVAASTTVAQPVLGCVLVQAGSTAQGSVSIDTAPNCNHGTGYRSFTALHLSIHPGPGFVFDHFATDGVNVSGDTATYVVDADGTGAFVVLSPRFAYACTTLTIRYGGPVGIGAFGSPECTQPTDQRASGYVITRWRQGSQAFVALDGFKVNDVQAVAYVLDGAPSGTALGESSYRLHIPMASDAYLTVRFGGACHVVNTGVSGGGGTLATQTPTNCVNPYGTRGYAPGTKVSVHYTSVAHASLDHFSGTPWPLPEWSSSGPDASFAISSDTSITAAVNSCHQLTVGALGFPEDGTVAAATPSNCDGVAGWYQAGTDVRVNWSSWYFQGWADDQPSAVAYTTDPHAGAVYFRMDTDRKATAIFRNPAMCPSLTVKTVPATGVGTANVTGPNLHSDYPCPPGTYPTLTSIDRVPSSCFARYVAQSAQTNDRGLLASLQEDYEACSATIPDYVPGKTARRVHQQWVNFTAQPIHGDPLVGWSYDTQAPPWADDPARGAYAVDDLEKPRHETGDVGTDQDVDIYGKTTATAWFCEKLTGQVELVHPDGTKKYSSARPGTDYLSVSPAPNCPIAPDSWVVGTTVRIAPAASKAGYAFGHYYGGATGAERVTQVTLDGAQPSRKIGISYDLVCHKLTVQSPGDVQKNPAPNCSGVGKGDWYIGGTMVGLNALDRGSDYAWQGWGGDAGTHDNPSWVLMDADKIVSAQWHTKNALDKAVDWVSGAYHSVSDFMTQDVPAYFASMKDASLVVLATMCKGMQMALQAFTSPTFGFVALPLNVLRLINLALDNDDVAAVIDEWSTVLDAMDISNLLLGCAADSVLGLNQGPDDLSVDDAKAIKDLAGTALKAYKMNKAGNANEVVDPNFGKVAAAGLAIKGGYTAYQIGTSIAEGNIATHGKELSDRYGACIDNLVPKRLATSIAGAVG